MILIIREPARLEQIMEMLGENDFYIKCVVDLDPIPNNMQTK